MPNQEEAPSLEAGPDLEGESSKRTKNLHVLLPLRLAERVRLYAHENETTVTSVVIEALDAFLRRQKR
jgi:hypothetical protein